MKKFSILSLVVLFVLFLSIDAFADNFSRGSGQFGYVKSQHYPQYNTGKWVHPGALKIVLGGVDNYDVLNLSSAWRQNISLNYPTQVTVRFRYKLTQSAHYELDEYSATFLTVNNKKILLSRIDGNGNGGYARTTGWKTVSYKFWLNRGVNVISISAFNNKKTYFDEYTTLLIDDVYVTRHQTVRQRYRNNSGYNSGYNFNIDRSKFPKFQSWTEM